MRKCILLIVIILSSSVLWAADKFQPLDVKTGLWETSMTHANSGAPPIPADLLAKLPPEQRARIEASMKAGGSGTTTTKTCITQEKLQKQDAFGDNRKECTHTVVTSSSSGFEMKIHCAEKEMSSDGTIKIEALSSENIKGVVHMVSSGGGNTMNVDMTLTSRYLGPACGDVK